jgi:polar amino acid transport system substrate-binding protein
MTMRRNLLGMVALGAALALGPGARPAQAQSASLVKEIQSRGTLKVGMAESPPWQSPNPKTGEYEGFNVDLAKRAAEIMGVKLEIVPATWSTLIPGLEAKQYDAVFANLFATPQRALVVNFTEPYSNYGFHVMVNAAADVKAMDALNRPEVTFVGMSGTVEESYPKELFPQATVKGIVTNDVATWVGEVASGRATAAFLDPGTYRILRAKNPNLDKRLRPLNGEDALVKPVGLAYAVRIEPESTHMLNFLNTFIRDFVRNGENVTLRDKWFDVLAQRD